MFLPPSCDRPIRYRATPAQGPRPRSAQGLVRLGLIVSEPAPTPMHDAVAQSRPRRASAPGLMTAVPWAPHASQTQAAAPTPTPAPKARPPRMTPEHAWGRLAAHLEALGRGHPQGCGFEPEDAAALCLLRDITDATDLTACMAQLQEGLGPKASLRPGVWLCGWFACTSWHAQTGAPQWAALADACADAFAHTGADAGHAAREAWAQALALAPGHPFLPLILAAHEGQGLRTKRFGTGPEARLRLTLACLPHAHVNVVLPDPCAVHTHLLGAGPLAGAAESMSACLTLGDRLAQILAAPTLAAVLTESACGPARRRHACARVLESWARAPMLRHAGDQDAAANLALAQAQQRLWAAVAILRGATNAAMLPGCPQAYQGLALAWAQEAAEADWQRDVTLRLTARLRSPTWSALAASCPSQAAARQLWPMLLQAQAGAQQLDTDCDAAMLELWRTWDNQGTSALPAQDLATVAACLSANKLASQAWRLIAPYCRISAARPGVISALAQIGTDGSAAKAWLADPASAEVVGDSAYLQATWPLLVCAQQGPSTRIDAEAADHLAKATALWLEAAAAHNDASVYLAEVLAACPPESPLYSTVLVAWAGQHLGEAALAQLLLAWRRLPLGIRAKDTGLTRVAAALAGHLDDAGADGMPAWAARAGLNAADGWALMQQLDALADAPRAARIELLITTLPLPAAAARAWLQILAQKPSASFALPGGAALWANALQDVASADAAGCPAISPKVCHGLAVACAQLPWSVSAEQQEHVARCQAAALALCLKAHAEGLAAALQLLTTGLSSLRQAHRVLMHLPLPSAAHTDPNALAPHRALLQAAAALAPNTSQGLPWPSPCAAFCARLTDTLINAVLRPEPVRPLAVRQATDLWQLRDTFCPVVDGEPLLQAYKASVVGGPARATARQAIVDGGGAPSAVPPAVVLAWCMAGPGPQGPRLDAEALLRDVWQVNLGPLDVAAQRQALRIRTPQAMSWVACLAPALLCGPDSVLPALAQRLRNLSGLHLEARTSVASLELLAAAGRARRGLGEVFVAGEAADAALATSCLDAPGRRRALHAAMALHVSHGSEPAASIALQLTRLMGRLGPMPSLELATWVWLAQTAVQRLGAHAQGLKNAVGLMLERCDPAFIMREQFLGDHAPDIGMPELTAAHSVRLRSAELASLGLALTLIRVAPAEICPDEDPLGFAVLAKIFSSQSRNMVAHSSLLTQLWHDATQAAPTMHGLHLLAAFYGGMAAMAPLGPAHLAVFVLGKAQGEAHGRGAGWAALMKFVLENTAPERVREGLAGGRALIAIHEKSAPIDKKQASARVLGQLLERAEP